MSAIQSLVTKTVKQNSKDQPKKNKVLWENYLQHKSENRMLFPLEGAHKLQVSELELLLASPYSQYLGNNCAEVLESIAEFKQIESIARNEYAVHEKLGQLQNLKLGKHMGIALDVGGLDLRIFMDKWQHMLAISDDSKATDDVPGSFSIQFFDDTGTAIVKIFLRDYSEEALQKWRQLIAAQASQANMSGHQQIIDGLQTPSPKQPWQYTELNTHDTASLHQQWLDMTDVHQFHFILKKLNLDRASSYRQAPTDMAVQLHPEAVESLLTLAQQQAKPLMTFVGNRGIVQIQTGVIHQLKRMGDWINILDKSHTDFTLHLKDKAISQLWCVKRPTKDGIVTCIEAFDVHGDTIVTFFGQRQEGEPEQVYWQQMTDTVMQQHALTSS